MIDRIIELRKRNSLNQEQFAEKLGLSRSFVNQVETGKRNISDRTISDICRIFNVNELWLRTGEGEPFVELSKDEQIAAFIGDVMKGEKADFRRRFVSVLSKLDVEHWKLLEEIAKSLMDEIKEADQ